MDFYPQRAFDNGLASLHLTAPRFYKEVLGLLDAHLLKSLGKTHKGKRFMQVSALIYIKLYQAWREILHLTSSNGI